MDVAYFLLLLGIVPIVFIMFPDILTRADLLSVRIFILGQLIAAGLHIYGVYLFRETIGYFKDRDVFNVIVIKRFSTIGKCIIAGDLISGISYLINKIIYGDNLNAPIEIRYDFLVGSVFVALFCMVLSEVFKMAKEMKEENELTV